MWKKAIGGREDTILTMVSSLLVISLFLTLGDTLTSLACIMFILLVPGRQVVRAIRPKAKLDWMENAILAVTIGAVASAIVYFIGSAAGWGWTSSVVFLGVPYVIIIELVILLRSRKVPAEGGEGAKHIARLVAEFKGMKGWEKVGVMVSIMFTISVLVGAVFVFVTDEDEQFTEFYALNEDGVSGDYPSEVGSGENVSLIIGISNHEGRTVLYTVEIWVVEYTYIDQAVNVTEMYFSSSFNVTLENQEYDLNDGWDAQYEQAVNVTMSHTGNYTLFLMLLADSEYYLPDLEPFDTGLDYATTEASWRVVLCVNDSINYLKLHVSVS